MVRIGPYKGIVGTLLRAFKYSGREELDQLLGGQLVEGMQASSWFNSIDVLTIVPTHWRHALGRSFYPPRALLAVVRRRTSIPVVPLLRRIEAGPHQFDVPIEKRRQNIRGKFRVITGTKLDGAKICLIDDVSTTGATLNECARVLKKEGAAQVFAAVICRVDMHGKQFIAE